jgi:predicted sugar kinase
LESNGELKSCLLGLTLQHPPVNLFVQAHDGLKITGARANIAFRQTRTFLQYHGLERQAEVEIELAIPAYVGLNSEVMLGLSMAKALAWLNDLPYENSDLPQLAHAVGLAPRHALAARGFEQGGLLLVETESESGAVPAVLRRREISHEERDAWAIVFYFPRIPENTPEHLGEEQLRSLLRAAPHLSRQSGDLATGDLWQAVVNDDIGAFGETLLELQRMNHAALASAGRPWELASDEQDIIDLMRDSGAQAWGRCLNGLGIWGLIRGGDASRALRKTVRDRVGIFGGIVMATITDNKGAQHVIRDENLDDNKMTPIRTRR